MQGPALTAHKSVHLHVGATIRVPQLTERIPRPSDERHKEVQPLLGVEQPQYCDWVLHFVHWRFQRAESGRQVSTDTHLLWRFASAWKSCIVALVFIVLGRQVAFAVRHHA